MNLPKKKFRIGDIVNINSNMPHAWYDKYLVEGHTLVYNEGGIKGYNLSKTIDERDLYKLKDKEIYIHMWLVNVKQLSSGYKHTYDGYYLSLDAEETRNYKINRLLNIDI